MLKFNNFFKYSKLFKFNCYTNITSFYSKQGKIQINSLAQNVLLYKSYLYYDFFFFVFFVYKLRAIIKNIIFYNGKFVFINDFFNILSFFKNFVYLNNQFYFNFHKGLFSSIMYSKKFLKKELGFSNFLDYFFLYDFNISFILLFLGDDSFLNRDRIFFFRQNNLPILHLSFNNKVYNDYCMPIFQNNRSVYF